MRRDGTPARTIREESERLTGETVRRLRGEGHRVEVHIRLWSLDADDREAAIREKLLAQHFRRTDASAENLVLEAEDLFAYEPCHRFIDSQRFRDILLGQVAPPGADAPARDYKNYARKIALIDAHLAIAESFPAYHPLVLEHVAHAYKTASVNHAVDPTDLKALFFRNAPSRPMLYAREGKNWIDLNAATKNAVDPPTE